MPIVASVASQHSDDSGEIQGDPRGDMDIQWGARGCWGVQGGWKGMPGDAMGMHGDAG